MAESQTKEGYESAPFRPKTAAMNRRHSVDVAPTSGAVARLHPYQRQFSDGASSSQGRLPQGTPGLGCLQQSSYSDGAAAPVEPSCFLPPTYPNYRSLSPQRQISAKRMFSKKELANTSRYSAQSQQQAAAPSSFTKPVYSYSILIFMALKSSRTGSLPVSEIYGFMTENFPYFKTAPDGWKNSVRHNLSLNKCFVKLENKNGSSSRKGCLWALNPAKVEKMQEELHKWRRKDPISVCRSMARPECLDRLLAERPDRIRTLPPYPNPAPTPRVPPVCIPSNSCNQGLLQPSGPSHHHQHQVHPQQPCYLSPPPATHPCNPFGVHSPCGQPTATGALNSPAAGKMPPDYSVAQQAEYSFDPRSVQDFLLEGDSGYDVDTLNPSLIDLQLQGNLWEELRDDGLVSDPHGAGATCFTSCTQQNQQSQTSSPLATAPPVAQRREQIEDWIPGGAGRLMQYDCGNGFHPALHSRAENLLGYVTSTCTTSVSLM